jgi:hypothetical protein
MSSQTARLGFASAFLALAAWVLFSMCFVVIALTRPAFVWTNLGDFLAFTRAHDQTLVYVAQACMLLFGPLYVLILCCLLESVPAERKTALRGALATGIVFAALTGINYFNHITAVRLNIERGTTAGLEQLLQHKPDSVMAAINVLGWSLYLGLSSLLAALTFSNDKLEHAIRIALVVNGLCCLLGGLGFALQNVLLTYLTLNVGMGGAMLAVLGLWVAFFGRHLRRRSALA